MSIQNNPVSFIQALVEKETDPFKKMHKYKDLGEVIVKLFNLISLKLYLNTAKVDSEMKAYLLSSLKAPALGKFGEISNKIRKKWGLPKWWIEFLQPLEANELKNLTRIVEIRNELAHASSMDLDFSKDMVKKMQALLEPILHGKFWENLQFEIVTSEDMPKRHSRLFATLDENRIDLTPFLLVQENSFLIFNGYDLDFTPTYIQYAEASKITRDPELKTILLETIPLSRWQENLATFFLLKIPSLRKHHFGRENLIRNVKDWVDSGQNSLLKINGDKGDGKSTFIAEIFEQLSSDNSICLIEFFFSESRDLKSSDFFYEHFLSRTEEYLVGKLSAVGPLPMMEEALRQIKISGRQTVFLWDGLEFAPKELDVWLGIIEKNGAKVICTANPCFSSTSITPSEMKIPEINEEEFDHIWDSIIGYEGESPQNIKEKAKLLCKGNPKLILLWANSVKVKRQGLGKRPLETMPGEVQNYFESYIKHIHAFRNVPTNIYSLFFLLSYSDSPISEDVIRTKLGWDEKTVYEMLFSIRDVVQKTNEGYTLYHSLMQTFFKLKYPTPYLQTIKQCNLSFESDRDMIFKTLKKIA